MNQNKTTSREPLFHVVKRPERSGRQMLLFRLGAVALSILAGELQKLMTAPETLALVEELYARRETLDTLHRREVEELRRSCRQLTRIPAEEYMAYSELTKLAQGQGRKRLCLLLPHPAGAGGV